MNEKFVEKVEVKKLKLEIEFLKELVKILSKGFISSNQIVSITLNKDFSEGDEMQSHLKIHECMMKLEEVELKLSRLAKESVKFKDNQG